MEKEKVTGSQDPVTSEEQSSYAEKEKNQNQNQAVEDTTGEEKPANEGSVDDAQPENSSVEKELDSPAEKSPASEKSDTKQPETDIQEDTASEQVKLIAEESKLSEENPIKEELVVVEEDSEKAEDVTSSEEPSEDKADPSKKKEEDHDLKADPEELDDEYENLDFSTMSKEELVDIVKKLGKEDNPFLADQVLRKIAPVFNKIREVDRQKALDKFIEDGGDSAAFQYQPDELSLRFDAN